MAFSAQNIKCQNCSISELCLPFSLNENEINLLDDIIQRKKPIQKNTQIFEAGEQLQTLYAIRSGTFKTFIISEQGEEQITGFHLAGDLMGFDALASNKHPSFAKALETSMVCEIPFEVLDTLSNKIPRLKSQMLNLMSDEIQCNNEMLLLLNRKNAEEKLATFLANYGRRLGNRHLSSLEFNLPMTRSEIGNYIGLTIETISRLMTRFQRDGLIKVDNKLITILDKQALFELAGFHQ
ncbi:fumarate/nitrate reduction transcriptional regulator Fnr [Thalassotalea ponticola]|uniref:fumarate/nitrate reduction transcriptional regulator Fnr n=1 Tax=Thalassotalea ponticola TaxID=1523392 RepID=UPI0025B2F068|nr:fumarate/nitrate reduction transcriptional regulator Fnr [Thalassotalea ponticola]MDN3651225.1 fumarate/nitrate reduction transcriptional regulator Fnr [Thalassotalea ponticola]